MEVGRADLKSLVLENARRSKSLFADPSSGESARKKIKLTDDALEPQREKNALSVRLHAEYQDVRELPPALAQKQASAMSAMSARKKGKKPATNEHPAAPEDQKTQKLIEGIAQPPSSGPNKLPSNSNALVHLQKPPRAASNTSTSQSLSVARAQATHQVKPDWHPPWKLMRVISGHLGWVRALAVEPHNQWFASGAGDRTIKIWDLATGNLRLTLTGHISTVRGLAVSPRHPYLFSCGEDKMVKCWELETN
ncbi:hypothetical protein PC116_g32845, partial [Phytophthora cactorum]